MKEYNGLCYTVLSGDYDTLKKPTVITPGWKYVCFTDQKNLKSDVWEIRPLPTLNDNSLSQIKKQRVVKISPHKYIHDYDNYDVSVYVDCSIIIKVDLNFVIEQMKNIGDFEICTVKHPIRKCIYKEEDTVVKVKKDIKEITQPQIQKYKEEGFPVNYGLNETNVMIRFKSNEVNEIMNDWEHELRMHSHRDQLSFNYVLWKHQHKIVDMPVISRNKWFRVMKHKSTQPIVSKTLTKTT